RLGRHHHHLHSGSQPSLPQRLYALQSIHHRHIYIQQHQVERLSRRQHRQRFTSIHSLFTHNAHAIQQVPQVLADKTRVIDNQRSHASLPFVLGLNSPVSISREGRSFCGSSCTINPVCILYAPSNNHFERASSVEGFASSIRRLTVT